MHSPYVRAISRVLIVCFCAVSMHAQAGLIGTGDTVAATQVQAGARKALVGQIAALGISSDVASDRVAALSDAEVAQLASQLDGLPAGGGVPGVTVGIAIVVIFLIWRFGFSDQAKAEQTREPVKEPAKKQ